jgi:hypothetical protein
MELTKLIFADTYRDGGSYSASFETGDGRTYNIWLQRSKMPDAEGLHHRWLFEYCGMQRPENSLPVVTGSEEESALLARLNVFMASSAAPAHDASLARLRELVHYIQRREPRFPSDLIGRRFSQIGTPWVPSPDT